MNGVHDLGGMHGFGPVVPEPHEPVFHADWERRTFALALATMGTRRVNVDEFRRTIERIPPARYLASSYYEHWLDAVEALLVEKRLLNRDEIEARLRGASPTGVPPAPTVADIPDEADAALWSDPRAANQPSRAVALRHDPKFKARFRPGDPVLARNLNPEGHTRLPRYARGRCGVIRRDWGTFVFPDTHAHGAGAHPQHCYSVEFSARELWGAPHSARDRVSVDLWEAYLAPDVAAAQARPAPARSAAPATTAKTLKTKTAKVKRARANSAKVRPRKPAPARARVTPRRANARAAKKASKRP